MIKIKKKWKERRLNALLQNDFRDAPFGKGRVIRWIKVKQIRRLSIQDAGEIKETGAG